MKTNLHQLSFSLVFFAGLVFLSGCMSTTQLQVLQPAAFKVPEHIETVATVNRSLPKKSFTNAIEGMLTGEGIGMDRSGGKRATEGLSNVLTRTPRFKIVYTGIEEKGSGGYRFPEPMSWEEVDRICAQYGAEAVAAIEKFDSDFTTSFNVRRSTRKDDNGNEIVTETHEATRNTEVRMGWRLYDPKSRQIIDEFDVMEGVVDDAEGSNQGEAEGRLTDKYRMVDEVSYMAGEKYGMRIAPTWITVYRQFYLKGKKSDAMAEAARLAKINRWEDASAIWKKIVNTDTNPKNAGKAAYNLALASERLGHLGIALDWAEKAYQDFGIKKGLDYVSILNRRMFDERQVDEQMGD